MSDTSGQITGLVACGLCGWHYTMGVAHTCGNDVMGAVWVPTDRGWVCPKCERVYSPKVIQCRACNGDRSVPEVGVW